MATIKDVAREAGVAVSTVSKYLNGGNVIEANRLAIDAAVKKLDFRANYFAKAMRSGRSRTVMVLVPQLENDYCCQLVKAAREALLRNGYATNVVESHCDTKEEQQMLQNALLYQLAGVITMSADPTMPIYGDLRRQNIPFVFIGRNRGKKDNCIFFDDRDKCLSMADHLLELGHKRIGLVTGAFEYRRIKSADFAYYINLLRRKGLLIDDSYVFASNGPAIASGMEAVDYFLAHRNPPTALLCMSTELMIGAQIGLHDHGMNTPDDMSLCALAAQRTIETPPFNRYTSICLPVHEAAERAVTLLMENISEIASGNEPARTTVLVPCTYHITGSIKNIASQD